MESKKVIAVIGCGGIATNAHFPALTSMDHVRIKYACDIILDKAKKMIESGSTYRQLKGQIFIIDNLYYQVSNI